MELTDIGLFIFLAFGACALELSFQRYIQEDMILHFWGRVIDKLDYSRFDPTRWSGKHPKLSIKLSMVLGGCKYCHGFWIAVGVYLLHYKTLTWYILLFTGINYLFIEGVSILLKKR